MITNAEFMRTAFRDLPDGASPWLAGKPLPHGCPAMQRGWIDARGHQEPPR